MGHTSQDMLTMAVIDHLKHFTKEEIRQIPEDISFLDIDAMNKKIIIDGDINLESDDWRIFISSKEKLEEVETAFVYLIDEYEKRRKIRS